MWEFIISVFLISSCSAERIIIIGAGAAGIATASRLLENNITDFRIIEAENRIGGRINSIHFGDAFVDLGAQNIHGTKGNLVYEISKNYLDFRSETKKTHAYYSGCMKYGNDLIRDFHALEAEISDGSSFNDSFGDVFLNRYESRVLKKFRNDKNMLSYAKDFIRSAECIHIEDVGAFRWFHDIASRTYEILQGSQTLSWSGLGYKTILDILLKNFPKNNGYEISNWISYGKTVTKIILNQKSVTIRCRDGSTFIADYVVFTPSLGVLKHDEKSIFEPRLSPERVRAIKSLGFDGVMKIIFEFPSRWWGEEEEVILVWSTEDRGELIEEVPFGPIKGGDHWLSWFFNIAIAPNNPNVLIGWIAGPMVPEIEQLTYEELEYATVYAMRKILGKKFNVTKPTKLIHSKWCTNPNFRGTYPYETIESTRIGAIDVLLQPIVSSDGTQRIFFAGDAMIQKRYSTVDGAITAGFREGDRLSHLSRKQ